MTLEGAINLNETTDYIIYTMNSATTGQYGVVVPKNINGTLNMLVDLHMKGSFDGVSSGIKTKEQLVAEISGEYDKLKTRFVDGMLVMPMIDEVIFQNTVATGDKQKMFDEVKKIGAITSELYKKLTDSGIDKQKIDQKIIIVEKNSSDEQFVLWLKEQMPNFVDGIVYSELENVESAATSLFNGSDLFGNAVSEEKKEEVTPSVSSVNSGGIFDNIAPVASSVVEPAPVITEGPVIPEAPIVAQEVVTPVVPEVTVAPVEPTVSNEVVNNSEININNDIFGAPVSNLNVSTPEVEVVSVPNNTEVVQENVAVNDTPDNPTPVVEEPKPVENATLEGTTTFSPIANPTEVSPAENNVEEQNVSVTERASKGFANLIILLIVLVGVTFISIELGKYLYSVYGA